ncbi:MAG: hypothetical protein ACE5IY_03190 [bacterium]
MPKKYPEFNPRVLTNRSDAPNLKDSNPAVEKVVASFSRIGTSGSYLAARDGGQIRGLRYTASVLNKLGIQNHFQGVQRLHAGNYMVVSGGDPHEPMAHLFVFKMGSRRRHGSWNSNIITGESPPAQDKLVRTVSIDRKRWHAGGLSVLGDILAVPIYSKEPDDCKIVFYHMADPENPELFDVTIDRPGVRAGAVAMTKLPGGRFLVAVWSDSDHLERRLDFYLSKSTDIFEGFEPRALTWPASEARARNGRPTRFENYQTVNLINQADGRLYVVGLHNTSDKAPTLKGKDYADLWEIKFPEQSILQDRPVLSKPRVVKMRKLRFDDTGQQSNMDGAAGVHIDRDGTLNIYATYHWRSDGLLNFVEYKEKPPVSRRPITVVNEAWIDMYEHDDFSGKSMSLQGRRHTDLRDYKRINVAGEDFGDTISSVRFQLPQGKTYRLFEHSNFRGKHLDLRGTGKVIEINDFDQFNFDNKVSSSQFLDA